MTSDSNSESAATTTAEKVAALTTILKKHGAAIATADYDGSGDDGGEWEYGAYSPPDERDNAKEIDLGPDRDAAYALLEALLADALQSSDNDGYGNDEGSFGSLTIDADGEMVLEHNVRYSDSDLFEYRFDPATDEFERVRERSEDE